MKRALNLELDGVISEKFNLPEPVSSSIYKWVKCFTHICMTVGELGNTVH